MTLNVSLGSTTTAVPEVTGLSEADARATLENAGWNVEVRDTTTANPDEDGLVITQDPAPGEQAEPGSTVVIFVARLESADPQPSP